MSEAKPRTKTNRHTPNAEPVAPLYVDLDAGGARVSLHPRTLRRAMDAGELPGYKFGSAVRVRLDELDAWAAAKAIPDPWNGRRRLAKTGRAAS